MTLIGAHSFRKYRYLILLQSNLYIIFSLLSLAIVFGIWILTILLSPDVRLDFYGLLKIHAVYPHLIFIDLLPFFFYFILKKISDYYEKRERELKKEIRAKEDIIRHNMIFAQEIGSGNIDYLPEFPMDNPLGIALINMRNNLAESYRKDSERQWISNGRLRILNIVRLYDNVNELCTAVLSEIIKYVNAVQGALYLYDENNKKTYRISTYAYNRVKYIKQEFSIGEGLVGECVFEKDIIYRTEIPKSYMTITSGILGEVRPSSLLLAPLLMDDTIQGVIELASLEPEIPAKKIEFIKEAAHIAARTIHNLKTREKTEKLLLETQRIANDLRVNEEKLTKSAKEMERAQEKLKIINAELQRKVQEVEEAQERLNALLSNASEIISIYDQNLNLNYISPSVDKILGYSALEIKSGKFFYRLTRKGETDFRNMFRSLIDNPEDPVTIQYSFMRKDGKKIFLETRGQNLLSDRTIAGILLNTRDVTEKIRAEKEERLRSRMQSLSENSSDLIMRISLTGQFIYVNPVIEKFLGIIPKNILNSTINESGIQSEFKNFLKECIKEIKIVPEKLNKQISILIFEDNKINEHTLSFSIIPEFNENELETILFVGHDITEEKRIQQEIQEKNRKIQDSINYAKHIQSSILPTELTLKEFLPDSFIYYIPRDVVSGDFPWLYKKNNYLFVAVVDCTGHGVPGAMLSFIGFFLLNNIVEQNSNLHPSEMLDILHDGVRTTLKQDNNQSHTHDGMDIALCKINLVTFELEFAGAHRPLLLHRFGQFIEYKGDKKPVGGSYPVNSVGSRFTNHALKLERGDAIYIFSDGITDQIGPNNKKFGLSRLKEVISSYVFDSYGNLKEHLHQEFMNFKKIEKQLDDVLVIGFKI